MANNGGDATARFSIAGGCLHAGADLPAWLVLLRPAANLLLDCAEKGRDKACVQTEKLLRERAHQSQNGAAENSSGQANLSLLLRTPTRVGAANFANGSDRGRDAFAHAYRHLCNSRGRLTCQQTAGARLPVRAKPSPLPLVVLTLAREPLQFSGVHSCV